MKQRIEPPKEALGRVLWMCIRQVMKGQSEALESSNLSATFHQFIILKIIYHHEEIVQQDIADLMEQDKSSILRQIRILEDRQWIAKLDDPKDKRRKFLVLTQKGAKTVEEGLAIEKLHYEQVTKEIDKQEYQIFLKVLNQIKEKANQKIVS